MNYNHFLFCQLFLHHYPELSKTDYTTQHSIIDKFLSQFEIEDDAEGNKGDLFYEIETYLLDNKISINQVITNTI
jgi:hypothetical protein